jgi:hypothetical protein
MENKRKEEIKQKVDAIGDCLEEIKLCEEELAKISEAFEFVERYWCCNILIKPLDKEENFKIPLMGVYREKVISTIKEELTKKARCYKDKILKVYQELDELLK